MQWPKKTAAHLSALALGAAMATALGVPGALAAAPLHPRVDELVAAKATASGQRLAAPAADAEFLRRAWLDFAGTIPSATQARQFIADPSPTKRAQLIGRLMAAPTFAERMAEVFNIQLMERNGDSEDWRGYLRAAFATNRPWDQMTREMLSPDFKDASLRGAGHFITRRLEKVGQQETDYPGLTRDVGRLFMGVDLQCCQCHRHLTVKEYKQVDFNGLFTVFSNARLQAAAGDYKTPWVQEGLMTNKYEFVSVLNQVKGSTGPRVPLGAEVPLPDPAKDPLWIVPPNTKTRSAGVPKFSALGELSRRMASPENPYFARNIANRIWWQFMGRGLVEPLDLHHAENPASHPELIDTLAKELVAHRYDLKWLVGELALTQAYQRTGVLPAGAPAAPVELFTAALERPLSAEQFLRAVLAALGEQERIVEGRGWEGLAGPRHTLKEFETTFLGALANAPREPELAVNPTLRAALFLRNNDRVQWLLERRRGNLVDRVASMTDTAAMADELSLAIFTRPAAAEEKAALATHLQRNAGERERALGRFAWAMISSIEFFTNH